MRSIIFSSILALIMALPASSSAQDYTQRGQWHLAVGGGISAPMGTLGDSNKTGGNAELVVGYNPYHSNHTWSLEASFDRLEQINSPTENLGLVHANMMVFMARYDQDLASGVYLTGGVGMVRHEFKQRFTYVVITNTDAHTGVAGGAGVRLANRVFLEGRVIYSFSSPDATFLVPVTLGLRF